MADVSVDEGLWLGLALLGLFLHAVGLVAYWRGVPLDADERRIRRMGIVSSLVHLLVKSVFTIGAILAMTQPWPAFGTRGEWTLFLAWRGGILLVLLALDLETVYLRDNRGKLTPIGQRSS